MLKKALARDSNIARTDCGASRLTKIDNGQNNTPKPDYLNGGEPEEVATSLAMQQMLEKKNTIPNEIIKKHIAYRAETPERAGNCRTLKHGKFHRGLHPQIGRRLFEQLPPLISIRCEILQGKSR